MSKIRFRLLGAIAALLVVGPPAQAEEPEAPAVIEVRELLAVPRVSRGGRIAFSQDPVLFQVMAGTWKTPTEGASCPTAGPKPATWTKLRANEKGAFQDPILRGGYAVATVECPRDAVYMLHARGHRHLFVNGVPRGGDVYNHGITAIPVLLKKGTNELLFKGGRGRLRARLERFDRRDGDYGDLYVTTTDATLPHLLHGHEGPYMVSVVVANTRSDSWSPTLRLELSPESGFDGLTTSLYVPPMPPLGTSRATGVIKVTRIEEGAAEGVVSIGYGDGNDMVRVGELKLRIASQHEHHLRSFVSDIDTSVQIFGVSPPAMSRPNSPEPGLVLSCHGAGVNALGQARSYEAKQWCTVVAPTNRRRFGFDWEDWGRLDFFEVKAEAERLFKPDPSKVHVTGHSMGGHGAWILGAQFPDRFGAVAPSAGWRDFWSYGGVGDAKEPSPVQAMLSRASNVSRTLLLERNYLASGVYVLHGDRDNNVPVSQARFMRERLAAFHPNFAYFEQPDAGHWWGKRCVDWPPLFEFLERNPIPPAASRSQIDFTTVNPAVSSRCYWTQIVAQHRSLEPSRITASVNREANRIELEATNIARLRLEVAALTKPFPDARGRDRTNPPLLDPSKDVVLKVGEIQLARSWPEDGVLHLAMDKTGRCRFTEGTHLEEKNPSRAGPFKEAFRNRFVMVVGTKGDAETNAAALATARYHADTWQYRGNGRALIMTDTEFLDADTAGRNVILYGNRASNAAWTAVLDDACPIRVEDGRVQVGEFTRNGDDLTCLFVYPRKGETKASVGAVGGTGARGLRAAIGMPVFLSGAGFPDWLVITPKVFEDPASGPQGAGFFDRRWRLEPDFAWQE